jgi:hypothetical protein
MLTPVRCANYMHYSKIPQSIIGTSRLENSASLFVHEMFSNLNYDKRRKEKLTDDYFLVQIILYTELYVSAFHSMSFSVF